MKASTSTSLGTERIGKLLFSLSMPAIVAQVINVLYNMIDRMYIGHIPNVGADALTGVGVTMPVILCISAFAALVSMGGAPRASIMLGKNDPAAAERILGNCTALLAAVAVVLTVVFQIFGQDILMAFGASENTISYAWAYMRIYALGTIFVQMSLGLNAFITAQGFAKISMLTVLLGAVCNTILDPIFIFGFEMGVRGAALATVISQGISCIWVFKFLTCAKSTLRIRKANLRLAPQVILPCLALGLSPFIMQLTESIIAVCFNTSLLQYGGDLAVGAMTILMSVMQFAMLPLQGLTQGGQPIISYNFGAGNAARVKRTFQLLAVACVSYSVVMWAVSMFAPRVFIRIFTTDTQLIAFTEWAIHIYMAVALLFGVQIACQQTLIALGNARVSLCLALLRKVILMIPLIFILPQLVADPVMGVFLAEPVSDVIAVCTTAITFAVVFRKTMKQMESRKDTAQYSLQ